MPRIESQSMSDFAAMMRKNVASASGGLPAVSEGKMHNRGRLCQKNKPVFPLTSHHSRQPQMGRIHLDQDEGKNALGQLVLTIVKLLHELLEKQAIRRIEAGSLNEVEIEKLGLTLMQQSQQIEDLRKAFRLEERDLNINLGPLGTLFKQHK